MNKNKLKSIGAISAGIALLLSLAAFSVLSATQQKEAAYTPTDAVERYYEAAATGDLKKAEKYIASEVLDFYENNANGITGTLSSAITDEGQKYKKVLPLNEQINGDTATVTARVSFEESSHTEEKEYGLIKEKDGWKLTFQ